MANMSDTVIKIWGDKEKINQAKTTLDKFIHNNGSEGFYFDFDSYDEIFEEFKEYESNLKEIQDKDPIGFKAGFEYMEIYKYEIGEDFIHINGNGRWCSPYLFFRFLAKKYELNMEYFDAEIGCNFSYLLVVKNGDVIEELDNGYYSKNTIKYLYNNSIDDFLESIEWYFDEEEEPVEEIDNLLAMYGKSRKEIMEEYAAA